MLCTYLCMYIRGKLGHGRDVETQCILQLQTVVTAFEADRTKKWVFFLLKNCYVTD